MVGRRKDLRKKYFEIFMLSLNSEYTLEEIGVRYGMTKQRVWQIVRFNELGNGDYYAGYGLYDQHHKTLLSNQNLSTIERNKLLRDWLRTMNVRLIRGKNDGTKSSS
jgi:hypothetical protein|tara:strand:+ start:1830 stop:2150 length:321 start_codon:yes stop_codon:yes gene_type:complete